MRDLLTVATYNIHYAKGTDREVDVARIVAVLRDIRADIFCLQEVDRHTRRSDGVDQAREIASELGMYYAFGLARRRNGGEFGNAVLSRFPIIAVDSMPLPRSSLISARGFVVARIDSGSRKFVCGSVHFGLGPFERRQQAEALLHYFRRERWPVILCGDFNGRTFSKGVSLLKNRFIHVADDLQIKKINSFHTRFPYKSIDHIFRSRMAGLRCIDARNIPATASDHLPVVATFTWEH
jgi:endonuclease/exonuclease/phosphatase family metal-dependent hydrolase